MPYGMNELPNPKKLVPDPQPRRGVSKGGLVAASSLFLVSFVLVAFWFLQ
jgi:hypothetical protein